MKAIRVNQFGGPEVLKLEELPDPQPAAGQVVVRIHAVGVNPVDTYIRSGAYPIKPPLPYTPGADAAGVIESVGSDVNKFKPGDRVWLAGTADVARGTYAQKALCSLANVHPLPQSLTFSQGAAVNIPYTTAYNALIQTASARAGESVLVHGATGGVGIACVQLAVSRGLTVIGTGGSERGRKLVKEEGATHVLDHTKAGYLDELMQFTNGQGVDCICEMLANVNLGKDLLCLARRGRILIIGNRGTVEINPRDLMKCRGQILGVMPGTDSERAEAAAAITAGLFNGSLRPIVNVEYPLSNAPKSHEDVIAGGSHGKIVLIP